ncbi:MAG TPA: glycoside hydrolase family 13 protein [Bacteroidota bacterium]|nr:glycoside hydrolase family 13 protein [Bacteroidota bacterium]
MRNRETAAFVPSWVREAIFYQIFPERFANGDPTNDPPGTQPWGAEPTTHNYFGGDLQGILQHLDYISALGVNCLYLNPIFWSSSNHKYHARDYLKIDPHFGDERVFKRLVDECHARGIRIILDAVFNHTGVDFFAFEDVRKNGRTSRYVNWFNIYSFPVSSPRKPNYECWWNLGDLPKLMTHHPEVRRYLFGVTEHWMQFGIDGWRLDVPNEISHSFWIEWRKLVKRLNPEAYIVGEIWDDGSPWLQGDQFDGVMNYRFRKACVEFFARRTTKASEFDRSLAVTRSLYPEQVNYTVQNLLGSHDTERFLTLCNGNKAAMKLAWLFQMTYLGAPMVYYGDEVGMTGGKDPGCRGTMIWDDDKQDRDLLNTMRYFISLRNSYSVFRGGTFEACLVDDARNLYGYWRRTPDGRLGALVVLNNSPQPQRVDLSAIEGFRSFRCKQVWPLDGVGGPVTELPGLSGAVFVGLE